LVEKALPIVGAVGREALTLQLVDLLVDRGVWFGSSCRDYGIRPDFARAVADQRRALDLNPSATRARINLARALIGLQDELPRDNVPDQLEVLREALFIVHIGLEHTPTRKRLTECLDEVVGEVQTILLANLSFDELGKLARTPSDLPSDAGARARALAEQAERLSQDGDLTGCVRSLIKATRADPSNPAMRTALLAAIEALMTTLRNEGGEL
jgi:hypothetical protein